MRRVHAIFIDTHARTHTHTHALFIYIYIYIYIYTHTYMDTYIYYRCGSGTNGKMLFFRRMRSWKRFKQNARVWLRKCLARLHSSVLSRGGTGPVTRCVAMRVHTHVLASFCLACFRLSASAVLIKIWLAFEYLSRSYNVEKMRT
jgi:hypothetical protein